MTVEPRVELRVAQKNLTIDRILDSALDLLAGQSAFTVTMDDVAKAAGVSRPTVYAHFQNKGEIVMAIANRLYVSGDEAYAALAAQPHWNPDSVRVWLQDVERRYERLAPCIRALGTSAPSTYVDHATNDTRDRYVRSMATSRDWGGLSDADIQQRCILFVVQVEAYFTRWVLMGFPKDARTDPLELLLASLCLLIRPALADS